MLIICSITVVHVGKTYSFKCIWECYFSGLVKIAACVVKNEGQNDATSLASLSRRFLQNLHWNKLLQCHTLSCGPSVSSRVLNFGRIICFVQHFVNHGNAVDAAGSTAHPVSAESWQESKNYWQNVELQPTNC